MIVLAIGTHIETASRHWKQTVEFPAVRRARAVDKATVANLKGGISVSRCDLAVKFPAVWSDILFRIKEGYVHPVFDHEFPEVRQWDSVLAPGSSLRFKSIGSDPIQYRFRCHKTEAGSLTR